MNILHYYLLMNRTIFFCFLKKAKISLVLYLLESLNFTNIFTADLFLQLCIEQCNIWDKEKDIKVKCIFYP